MKLNQFKYLSNIFVLILMCSFSSYLFYDINYQLLLQNPATDCYEWMINFYDLIMAHIVLGTVFSVLKILLIDPMHHKDQIIPPLMPEEVIPEAQPLMPSVAPSEIMEIITSPEVIDTVGLFDLYGWQVFLFLASVALSLKGYQNSP
jgi:hypothetical protein